VFQAAIWAATLHKDEARQYANVGLAILRQSKNNDPNNDLAKRLTAISKGNYDAGTAH
jgi:hypothetical protein